MYCHIYNSNYKNILKEALLMNCAKQTLYLLYLSIIYAAANLL